MANAPISRNNADHYVWGNRCDGWHLVNSPELSVIQEQMPSGTAEVLHFHERAQQFFFLLAGQAIMEIDGREIELRAGEGIHIEAKTRHRIRNASNVPLDFVVISQPHSHGDRITTG